ncbi:MAG: hypothetical protein MPJ50_13140 [Pirellulales bacterium]|nr:hypothetical protein [Pirellulales bacterium]
MPIQIQCNACGSQLKAPDASWRSHGSGRIGAAGDTSTSCVSPARTRVRPQVKALVLSADRSVAMVVNKSGIFASFQLPDPAWINESLDASTFYFQVKRNPVSIDLSNTTFSPAELIQVRAGLEEQVRAAGGTIAENTRVQIVCKTRSGERRTAEYVPHGIRRNQKTQRVTYETYINELFLYEDGSLVWKKAITSGGPAVAFGTMAEIRSSTNRNAKPSVRFFTTADLSRSVPRIEAWRKLPTFE